MNSATVSKIEHWQHPASGERATLTLLGAVTRLERGSEVTEHHNPPFDQAEEQRKAEEKLRQHPGRSRSGQIRVMPPPDDWTFQQMSRTLRAERFIRMTARTADGAIALPTTLEPYRTALESSSKPVVRMAADATVSPASWSSTVGGVPYRPKGSAWPQSGETNPRPLIFLAQINLADANADGSALPEFPTHGILQFFILNTELYGADLTHPLNFQGHHRVLYWPTVNHNPAELESTAVRPEYDQNEVGHLNASGSSSLITDRLLITDHLPHDFKRETALTFVLDQEILSGEDEAASRVLGLNLQEWRDEQAQTVRSGLCDLETGGHKLGGYPNFTQSDPRQPEDDLTLLFQLDSDDDLGVTWGDVGIGNFFIQPADLKALDFSRVAYHWDCS